MRPTIISLAAAALMTGLLAQPAGARCDGCGVAAGVVGGVAAGVLLGSALAGPRQPQPVYVEPPPPPPRYYYVETDDGPICHVEHQRIWVEGYGWRHRRLEICD